MTGAQFEIRIDGTPRTCRDRKDYAMEAARLIKSKNPHSAVEVRDLQVETSPRRLSGRGERCPSSYARPVGRRTRHDHPSQGSADRSYRRLGQTPGGGNPIAMVSLGTADRRAIRLDETPAPCGAGRDRSSLSRASGEARQKERCESGLSRKL